MGNKIITCTVCGREMRHYANGMCQCCYKKSKPKTICTKCGRLMYAHVPGICCTCHEHAKDGTQSMYENKESSTYLGIVIGETLLKNYFTDIKQMPNNNIGFDFLCSKNMKIDSKISPHRIDNRLKHGSKYWSFSINRNTIADYFCCVAIDERCDAKDIVIVKAWLIPRDALSMTGIPMHKLTGLGISLSNIPYWSQYEISSKKLNACCKTLNQRKEII